MKSTDIKTALKAEFIHQYNQKPYDKINIKELCAATPAARTTFYSYYQNLDELKQEIEDEVIAGLRQIAQEVSGGNLPDMDFRLFFSQTIDYIREHRSVIYSYLITQPNLSFIEKWKTAIKVHYRMRYPEKTGIANYGLISEVFASAVISAYIYWMRNPEEVDTEKLNQVTVSALNAMESVL